ncbi:unnamed protein product [Phytophthora lilii]|uniref:Unnamed protein product n=1 Tax=Phytophthora lilii TaxID=2077276 RepID=A0A9W6TRN1_9STRA|nr:unnamed protein product [Phytophthora lilii]
MGRGLPLTDIERGRIQGLYEAGYSQRQVAQKAWTSHLAVGPRATAACPYSGQGQLSAKQLQLELKLSTSVRTIQRELAGVDWLVYSKMDNTLPLSTEYKRAREAWAWDMVLSKDPVRSWEAIVFSDEKKWNIDGPDGFQNYWRDIRRPLRQTKRRQAGGGSVMVWAGISAAGKTKLAVLRGKQNSDDYVHTVSEFLLPFAHLHYGTDFTFQQDGASIHRSKVSMELLREQEVRVLPWPARSSDLNPIENLWSTMSRRYWGSKPPHAASGESCYGDGSSSKSNAICDSFPNKNPHSAVSGTSASLTVIALTTPKLSPLVHANQIVASARPSPGLAPVHGSSELQVEEAVWTPDASVGWFRSR